MKILKNLSILAIAICGLTLVACSADDDTEVYMNGFGVLDKPDEQTLKAPSFIGVPKMTPDKDLDQELNKYFPTDFIALKDAYGNITGYYGYIDLGLSEKWAVNDVGAEPIKNKVEKYKTFDEYYDPEPYYEKIKSIVDNGMKEVNRLYQVYLGYFETNGDKDKITSFKEFKKMLASLNKSHFSFTESFSDNGIKPLDVYNTMLREVGSIEGTAQSAFAKAVREYETYLLTQKYAYLQQIGEVMYWGYNNYTTFSGSVSGSVPDDHYKSVPQDYGGNVKYDAATNLWGDKWRTPNLAAMQELINNCKMESTHVGGVSGFSLTGPSGKAIFIPNNNDLRLLTSTKEDSSPYWANFYIGKFVYSPSIEKTYNGRYKLMLRPVLK